MSRSFALVFAEMIVGGFATLVFVPPNVLGRSFYRFMGTLYAALYAASLVVAQRAFDFPAPGAWGIAFGALLLIYLMLVWSPVDGFGYLAVWLAIPVGAGFLWALAADVRETLVPPISSTPLLAGSFLLSALLTGSAMTAMLFGHWYLTTPDLPTKHLRRLNVVVLLSLGGVAAWLALTVWIGRGALGTFGFFSPASFGGIFLMARALFGVVAASVSGFFTWFCLREESTQAATGFLYLVVTFALMGELIGHYLLQKVALPL